MKNFNTLFALLVHATLTLLFYNNAIAQNIFVADVNINTERSMEGVSEFDRDVFINLHSSHTVNDWETEELSEVVNDLNITFGRSVGGVTWQMNRIDENPNQPGFFDLNHMQTLGQQSRNFYNNQSSTHQFEPSSFVMTSHISPLYPNGTATDKGWAPANYQAVGQFYGHLIKDYYGGNGQPRPTHVEVINEPFVHSNDLNTTNANISEFHNVVADSIRFHNPAVQVGGFAAAWPEFERNDFSHWDDTWRTFIDIAGDKMDFFSFHIYDTPHEGAEAKRKGSNAEAIFDMIEQYSMLQLGEVKPMMVTEYGACCADWDGPYYPERDWLNLKSVSSLTLSMMDRPHKILKAIPFIVDKAVWYSNSNGFPYPHVLLQSTNGGSDWEYTHLVKYYELWKNVEGKRIDSWSHDPDLQIDGYIKENKAYIILNNLEHGDRSVELNLFENEGNVLQDIVIKHLYDDNKIPQLDEVTSTTLPSSLVIGKEGTMVLEYTFTDPIALTNTQNESKYYSDVYLQEILPNSPKTFNINGVTTGEFGEATLRVGIGREHGKSLQPTITLNGTTLSVPSDWKGYNQSTRNDFFGVLEIPFDYSLLQDNNIVTVAFDDNGGHISTVTMQVKNFTYDPIRTMVSIENPLPEWAEDLILFPNPASYEVQFKGLKTTEEVNYSIFNLAGQEVLNGILPTQDAVVNIEKLPQGLYQIQLRAEGGFVVKKLIRM